MIQKIQVKNYQSHDNTEIELGGFTVLVGESSAGKSAFTRAVKALASNQAGTDFITHGEATMQVSATTDRGVVTLTKGKPADSYVILDNEDPKNPRRWTKLGGTVPEEVTEFLGIAPKDAVNFAGQFDMPFLLTTSSAEVARRLGDLTGVAAIFEASREGLRIKNERSREAKTREADLAAITPKLEALADVDKQLDDIDTAADVLRHRAYPAKRKIERLDTLLITLKTASAALATVKDRTSTPIPDLDAARTALGRSQRLAELLSTLSAQSNTAKTAHEGVETATRLLDELDRYYDALLQEAGTCPTCGQNTEGVHAHAG